MKAMIRAISLMLELEVGGGMHFFSDARVGDGYTMIFCVWFSEVKIMSMMRGSCVWCRS